MRASGEVLGVYLESAVVLDDMIAMMAIPMEVPNWATVLKTAPARAWVCGGKTSVTMRFAIVKMTMFNLSGQHFR